MRDYRGELTFNPIDAFNKKLLEVNENILKPVFYT